MTFRTIRLLASLVVAFLVSFCVVDCADFSHGWGDDIAWVSLEKGREISATENKPLMVRLEECCTLYPISVELGIDLVPPT